MAANGQPPTKKQKLHAENMHNSSPMFELPKTHPVTGLYNPEMVEITVSDQSKKTPLKMTFTIPKALIRSRSEYFDKLFEKHFAEGISSTVELSDVHQRTFRCFIGWLYCHRIFLDDVDRATLETLSAQKHDDQDKPSPSESRDTLPEAGDHSSTNISGHGETVQYKGEAGSEKGGDDDASIFGNAPAPAVDDQRPTAQSAISNPTSTSKTPTARRPDLSDPVDWPWRYLFELYVFADKYSTRDFRMATFMIIQAKYLLKRPPTYAQLGRLPPRVDLLYAIENLPSSSPLFRFLAHLYGLVLHLPLPAPDESKQVEDLKNLPSEFLAACLGALKRHYCALACKVCSPTTPHREECSHKFEERTQMPSRSPCFYHEHDGDDEEAARCAQQWNSWKSAVDKLAKKSSESRADA